MTPVGALQPYRVYSGFARSSQVARELASSHVPFLVVKRPIAGGPYWYVFEVTDELLRRLDDARDLTATLDLHEPQGHQVVSRQDLILGSMRGGGMRGGGPANKVVLDAGGNPAGVAPGDLNAVEAEIFPAIEARPQYAEPDEIVEFEVALESTAPLGTSAMVPLSFGQGKDSVHLHAAVSSRDFTMPKGTEWRHVFVIGRDLATLPLKWSFRARAIGERASYSVIVRFTCCGNVVGAASATVARKPAVGDAAIPVATSGRLGSLEQRSMQPSPATMEITFKGADAYEITFFQKGEHVASCPWIATDLQSYANDLEQARSLDDVRNLGYGLMADLPLDVQRFLDDRRLDGVPILIVADSALVPFEVIQLRAAQNGPFLGVARPIVRWIGNALPDASTATSHDVVCIRPDYPASIALPSAAQEETYLRGRCKAMTLVQTTTELRQTLATSAAVVHFAGHADGNPAQLSLQDAPAKPYIFHPSTALMKSRPFMFLNGCRAGAGRSGSPSSQSNMAKQLLQAGAKGIVAPIVQTQSTAALEAARTFYDAISVPLEVGEAARRIRERAMSAADPDAASLLSYLAFCSPVLKLTL
jgi:hypothetical protein